tara:strand:+ start:508 stop:954 length:447 start_codon:yes stop_codon:yes gene_type:complete
LGQNNIFVGCRFEILRIIGIDPGLRNTGWGIIELKSNRLVHVDDGRISPPAIYSVGERLLFLKNKLTTIVENYNPNLSAIEQIFVGPGTGSSLKLGMARGVSMLVLAHAGLSIKELPPKLVKKNNYRLWICFKRSNKINDRKIIKYYP